MAEIDGRDLALHNNRQSCWLAINGAVWDVTKFVDQHPGGSSLILKEARQDATEAYEEIHDAELVEKTFGPDAKRGSINVATIPKLKAKPSPELQARQSPPLRSMINLHDFEKVAERTMTPTAWVYVSSVADDEISSRENGRIYQKIFLRGRIL